METVFDRILLSPGHTVLRRHDTKGQRRFFEEVLGFFVMAMVVGDGDDFSSTAEAVIL